MGYSSGEKRPDGSNGAYIGGLASWNRTTHARSSHVLGCERKTSRPPQYGQLFKPILRETTPPIAGLHQKRDTGGVRDDVVDISVQPLRQDVRGHAGRRVGTDSSRLALQCSRMSTDESRTAHCPNRLLPACRLLLRLGALAPSSNRIR
jgi:hypothetical protein